MIEAKLKGEGIETGAAAEPDRGNVVDLMAALKKSLAQAEPKAEAETAPATTPPAKAEACGWSGTQGAAQASLNVRSPVGPGTSR